VREGRAGTVGRLTKRAEFVAAASGRRFHTERMTVQGRLRDEDGPGPSGQTGPVLRFGLTVTKRVGHAVERNRIKRRLRTACRLAAPELASVAADVVVIGRRDILTAAHATLVDDLRRALRVVTKPRTARRQEPPSVPPQPLLPRSPLPLSPPDGERRGSPHDH
jgi:ribonuclease P protein component